MANQWPLLVDLGSLYWDGIVGQLSAGQFSESAKEQFETHTSHIANFRLESIQWYIYDRGPGGYTLHYCAGSATYPWGSIINHWGVGLVLK